MITIRPIEPKDWSEVERIYLNGISTGNATFETSSPGWESWDSSHLSHSRWMAFSDNRAAGWIALSPVSDRCVYGGVAEVSVYIDEHFRGQGIGKLLLNKAIASSEENGIWTLNAATFPENRESIGLHLKCGFREIGVREKIGKLHGEWRDTVIMEKRSSKLL